MKKVTINNVDYEIIEDFNDGFNHSEVESKLTEYYSEYDYIFGDWAYNKLRLKGFCDKTNKNYRPLNDISNKDKYLKDNCAYGCKHFLLKKSV